MCTVPQRRCGLNSFTQAVKRQAISCPQNWLHLQIGVVGTDARCDTLQSSDWGRANGRRSGKQWRPLQNVQPEQAYLMQTPPGLSQFFWRRLKQRPAQMNSRHTDRRLWGSRSRHPLASGVLCVGFLRPTRVLVAAADSAPRSAMVCIRKLDA